MATTALTVATKFTAQDKMTPAVKKMTTATTQFTKKASAGFARVQRAERKVRQGFSKLTGKLGQLGLAFGALAIMSTVVTKTIELDANLASLQAITGVTDDAFKGFAKQVGEVSKAQKTFAGDTAKAFEVVASAQPILLENAEALGAVTNAAITLSKASGDDLASSASSLTGVMNQFSLGAEQAARTMNVLAAGSVAGSANITNVAASMKNFGAVAAGANIKLESAVALVEVMGSKSIFAEDAGNKLKAAVLNLQGAGLGYESGLFNISDALTTLRKKVDAARTAKEKDAIITKVFKKTGITTGQILLNNIDKYNKLTIAVTGQNTAVDQMNTKANTLQNRLNEVRSAFLNQVTSTDSSNESMQKVKETLLLVTENMDRIIPAILTAVKVFAVYKAIMIVATAVQWAFNIAAAANPVGLIVIAILALIAVIVILVVKWKDIVNWVKTSDNVFAKFIRGALKPIMWIVDGIRKAWDNLKAAFKSGGMMGALKSIGKSLLAYMLAPLEAILKVANKLTGGKVGGKALEAIAGFRDQLLAPEEEQQKALNPDATVEKVRTERIEKTKNEKVEIGVTATGNSRAEIIENSGIPVNLSNTLGWQAAQ